MSAQAKPARIVQPGVCRVCGCTEDRPCLKSDGRDTGPCAWFDADRTLCDSARCVGQVSLEELGKMKLPGWELR